MNVFVILNGGCLWGSADGGIGTVCGMFGPLLWGSLYRYFMQASEGPAGAPVWLRWGQGGHFFVTAGVLVLVFSALRGADPATLFLTDEDKTTEPEPEPESIEVVLEREEGEADVVIASAKVQRNADGSFSVQGGDTKTE